MSVTFSHLADGITNQYWTEAFAASVIRDVPPDEHTEAATILAKIANDGVRSLPAYVSIQAAESVWLVFLPFTNSSVAVGQLSVDGSFQLSNLLKRSNPKLKSTLINAGLL